MSELKQCPCGQTPSFLIPDTEGTKYAFASGDCCNDWFIEARINYMSGDEAQKLLRESWNSAGRAGDDKEPPK
jgi:hypothetical protein